MATDISVAAQPLCIVSFLSVKRTQLTFDCREIILLIKLENNERKCECNNESKNEKRHSLDFEVNNYFLLVNLKGFWYLFGNNRLALLKYY